MAARQLLTSFDEEEIVIVAYGYDSLQTDYNEKNQH